MTQFDKHEQSYRDIVLEKLSNLEGSSNRRLILTTLDDCLSELAPKETLTRTATIVLRLADKPHELKMEIAHEFERLWSYHLGRAAIQVWTNADNLFVKFISEQEKGDFLTWMHASGRVPEYVKESVVEPNYLGQHYERAPVKLMLFNIKRNLSLESIEKTLDKIIAEPGVVSMWKEGNVNTHHVIKGRNIYFQVNQAAYNQIFSDLDGEIPYCNSATNTRILLRPKINARLYVCRECCRVGAHRCEGKICLNCGKIGHEALKCQTATKFCSNCRRPGHRAKDVHCPCYLSRVAKELGKMDIPLNYLHDHVQRIKLIKQVQLV